MTKTTKPAALRGSGPIGDPDAPPDPMAASSQHTAGDWVRWALRKIGLVVAGLIAYGIAVNWFGKDPQLNSQLWSWVVTVIMCLIALFFWIRSERERDE